MNLALATLKLKDAALYHDRVVPLNLSMDHIWEFSEFKRDGKEYFEHLIEHGVLDKLLPAYLISNDQFMNGLMLVNQHADELMRHVLRTKYRLEEAKSGTEIEALFFEYISSIQDLASGFELGRYPVDAGEIFLEENSDSNVQGTDATVGVALAELELIDTSGCSWEHILEFRQDKTSAQKLRQFRLHWYEKYDGKDKQFIQDDLQYRVAEYDDVVSEWGFKKVDGSLGMLLSSKVLASGAAASLVSTLAEAPIAALLSIAGGATIEVGRIALHVRRENFLLESALRKNPISYVKYAEEILPKPID